MSKKAIQPELIMALPLRTSESMRISIERARRALAGASLCGEVELCGLSTEVTIRENDALFDPRDELCVAVTCANRSEAGSCIALDAMTAVVKAHLLPPSSIAATMKTD